MKIDHIVMNVDRAYQTNQTNVSEIRNTGLCYQPNQGKGTKGFKVSNIWIGHEYLEMVAIRSVDGGGWIKEWTELYHKGHRGMVCLMIDVADVNTLYQQLNNRKISLSKPEWLEFKWFFNLFTRRMPWQNSYLDFFEGVPFQIGFQQMKDEKSRDLMNQYMIPNSRDNGITGIEEIVIRGAFTNRDFELIRQLFPAIEHCDADSMIVFLEKNQRIHFKRDACFSTEIMTCSTQKKTLEIENVTMHC